MKILIATKNPGKFEAIQDTLAEIPAEFVSLDQLGITAEFEENGEDFSEIALGKALFYHTLSGLPTVADDSGIFIEILRGELGHHTRRWGAGVQASDEEWLAVFMVRLEKETHRDAEFICAAAFVNGEERIVFVGRTKGMITMEIEAPLRPGIPLSSVFKPMGCDRVYAALSAEEKRRFSHRGKAFGHLLHYLKTHV